jgi:hypothetical protein
MERKSNIERLKFLAEEISKKEDTVCLIKEETISCLSKIKDLLTKPRMNKKNVIDEVEKLISKLS